MPLSIAYLLRLLLTEYTTVESLIVFFSITFINFFLKPDFPGNLNPCKWNGLFFTLAILAANIPKNPPLGVWPCTMDGFSLFNIKIIFIYAFNSLIGFISLLFFI